MKVLFITPWYPNEKNTVSGTYVYELARAISGFCAVCVFHSYPDPTAESVSVTDVIEEGIRVVRMKRPISRFPFISYASTFIRNYHELGRVLRSFQPDIIHAHVYKSGIIGLITGRQFHIPVIITEHAKIVDPFQHKPFQSVINFLKTRSARYVYNHADCVIAVSRSLETYIRNQKMSRQILIVPNIVNTDLFYRQERPAINPRKNILFVGGLTPVKGLVYLLEAVTRIAGQRSDFVLNIVGDGPKRSEYEEIVRSAGISDFIMFHGAKKKEETAQFMRECDFLVLPSMYETFGIVLIEAMACGKPVISTNNGGQTEFIDEKNGLLVPPGDSDALKDAIEFMLDNTRKYSPESIEHSVTDRFSYTAVRELMRTIYTAYSHVRG